MTAQADPFGDRPRATGARPDTRAAWYAFSKWGKCEACGRRRFRFAHHVVLEQIVIRHGGNRWAGRNRILICDPCHRAHHGGGDGRIPLAKIRLEAIAFAVGLLGQAAAEDYFRRRYLTAADRQQPNEGGPRA